MTRLEAINETLFMIGESFINSLDDMSYEAQSVSELIDMMSRETCTDGQPFNVYPVTFQPDSNGEILLSDDIISVDVLDATGQYRAVKQSGSYRIKDISQNTYTINKELQCSCKILLDFDELDPMIQNYIVKKVSVKKVSVDLGNKDLTSMALNDLDLARGDYLQHNIDISDCNFDDTSFNSLFSRYYEIID